MATACRTFRGYNCVNKTVYNRILQSVDYLKSVTSTVVCSRAWDIPRLALQDEMPIVHMGFPKIRGNHIRAPHSKNYSILGSPY